MNAEATVEMVLVFKGGPYDGCWDKQEVRPGEKFLILPEEEGVPIEHIQRVGGKVNLYVRTDRYVKEPEEGFAMEYRGTFDSVEDAMREARK